MVLLHLSNRPARFSALQPFGHAPTLLALVLFLALIFAQQSALADGKYFGAATLADSPAIASQRALVIWRDGRETLVVESTVRPGSSESLGWVVPLPAKPDSIGPCTPGTLKSLVSLLTPRILDWRTGEDWMSLGIPALLLSLMVCFVMLTTGPKRLLGLLIVLCGLLLIGLFLPALATARGFAAAGVEVQSAGEVGSYDVSIISGDSSAAITDWLESNGFSCDAQAKSIFADYVAQGWCFAVAKLVRAHAGPMTPHPLKLSFPTSKPVYPMRLTGLTSEPLMLDLFVLADQIGSVKSLKTWRADRYRFSFGKDCFDVQRPQFVSEGESLVGMPSVVGLMWDGCVMTRLHGRLQPNQMQQDFQINFAPYLKPIRHSVYSKTAALRRSVGMAMLVLAAALPIVIMRARRRDNGIVSLPQCLLGALALVTLGASVYATCDVQPMVVDRELWRRSRSYPDLICRSLKELKEKPKSPVHELQAVLNDLGLQTFFAPQWQGDTPLGFEIETHNDGWALTLFDSHGLPSRCLITPDGSLVPLSD